MGEVFLGHDPRLERRVALKCLIAAGATRADDQARMLREARAAARLNHPNIAAVYDVLQQDDRTFIVMEYVEGESLASRMTRERIPIADVRRIGRQLASALSAAHAQGVVHRDLKPANIHVAADGSVKVLDFGVAKVERAGATAAGGTVSGANPGTPIYMSPEQLLGHPLDARSDIYSAGVILYELATGRRPFEELNAVALALAMQSREPVPPRVVSAQVPDDLSDVIVRMLARDPAERFQSIRDVEALLSTTTDISASMSRPPARSRVRRWAAVWMGIGAAVILLLLAVAGRPFLRPAAPAVSRTAALESIAVVPLENLSADSSQEYIADGMTESIITELGRVRSLRVISRQSMMQFKHTRATVPQIAAQLGVGAVMTGSVTRDGERLHVTVALMQPTPERQLWAETYDRRVGDALGLSSELAQTAVKAVRVTVTPAEEAQLAQTPAMKPEAQQAYLLGRFYWNKRTRADNEAAMQQFQKAIAVDPNAALGYAGLADCYIVAWDEGYLPPEEAYREAKANALRATSLDDGIAEAHASLGAVYSFSVLWTQAEQEYRRALELNPGFAKAHQWYSINLGALGRHAEAVAEARRAVQLDPLSPVQKAFLGRQLYFAGDYAGAEDELKKTLEMAPTLSVARSLIGRVYLAQRRNAEAIAMLDEASKALGRPTGDLGYAYAVAGNAAAANRTLRELTDLSRRRYVHPIEIGMIYVGLGDRNDALEWILKEYGEREGVVQDLAIDPRLQPVADDARFQAILRKSGLAYAPGRPVR